MSWQAALISGAVRDRSRREHLPHVTLYELRYDVPGRPPQLESQGRMALPGWGDPEGQGSFPPATIGHGAPSFDTLEQALLNLGRKTDSRVRLGGGRPLGLAPAVTIRAQHPDQLLAGPIKQFLAAARFTQDRYDGVFIEVDDSRGTPVWIVQTSARLGQAGCETFRAGARQACAFAGVP